MRASLSCCRACTCSAGWKKSSTRNARRTLRLGATATRSCFLSPLPTRAARVQA
jgi:hypothetical protein